MGGGPFRGGIGRPQDRHPFLLRGPFQGNEDEEAEAYILKDTSDAASEEAVYEFVEEDSELESVGKVFSELMDDGVELK